jgi:Pyruvate/2-oxoacid:ferredoxin oxidoreductase delta subunit
MVSAWPFCSPFFKNILVEKPVPQPGKCTLCYQCRGICPADAINKSSDGKVPAYDYTKCIRCYCCAEICPEAAIELQKGFVARLIG